MKLNYLLFSLLLSILNFCYSQTYVILDSITKEPIPYVAIKYVGESDGFYTDEHGQFTVTKRSNDSIQLSCLGYADVVERFALLKDTIYLAPKAQKLEEVIVHSASPTLKTIGLKEQNFRWFMDPNLQLGILVKPSGLYEGSYITKIVLPIHKSLPLGERKAANTAKPDFRSVFKVHLFSNKNGFPDEPLLKAPIAVYCNQDSNNSIAIDISKENIRFAGEGLFICIEMIGELDAKGTILHKRMALPSFKFTNKPTKDFSSISYYKGKFSDTWKVLGHEKMYLKKDIFLAIQLVVAVYEK